MTRKNLGLVILALFLLLFTQANNASATPVVGFEAGNIIDDLVFTYYQSMSVNQIQTFLNSKVPICDNWGTNGSTPTARRDYFISKGYSLPLTCLKDYSENGKTSSQIIYDAAQEYKINPQVLIVLLQKEQGLVTDDWPDPTQYKSATGYGCPDGAACNSDYYGFTNQVQWSARMFRAIFNDSPTWYTPYELGNNYIQYSPNASCGGTNVYIKNHATQALYNYTPYQPNAAALSAGYGTGDYCSAYGNRNFYQYFTDWFRTTKSLNGDINSDLKTIKLGKNSNGNYLFGNIVIVEWINGVPTVPAIKPTLRMKSTDGTITKELFVASSGTNTYYFDGFIDDINKDKEYYIEASSGDPYNISANKSMYVHAIDSNLLGRTSNGILVQYTNDTGILKLQIGKYQGDINSDLKTIKLGKNSNGNYLFGNIVIVEWINGVPTVPYTKPRLALVSTDKLASKELFISSNGTNYYYFDGFIDSLDMSKDYYIEVSSSDIYNISKNMSMNTRTLNDEILGRLSNNITVKITSENYLSKLSFITN